MIPTPTDVAILTVIPVELRAVCAVLGLADESRVKHVDGTVYYRGAVHSHLARRDYTVVVGCIGYAGNYDAAAATTALLKDFTPGSAFLVGIAAGIRGKTRIGEALFSERVVAYEPAAVVRRPDGTSAEEPRPDIERLTHSLRQDLVAYLGHSDGRASRLEASFAATGTIRPDPRGGQEGEFAEHVARRIDVRDATIASGEKLLRDPSKLKTLRESLHGKIEAGEMEAAGFANACERARCPWLVVRGVSDFGDDLKHDGFHGLAAGAAAASLVDFLAHGLELAANPTVPSRAVASPYVVGTPIERDEDFFGREAQKAALLGALQLRRPVQILGERRMGKTSLLLWAQRHAPADQSVVRVDAQGLVEKSPTELMLAVARGLNRHDVVGSLLASAPPSNTAAARAAQALVPLVLLVDEADALAERGHRFDHEFLGVLRSLGQARRLVWVSASRRDLRTLFLESGLGSDFLNDSGQPVRADQLEPAAARALVARRAPGSVDMAVAAAGGFAFALQALGVALQTRGPRASLDVLHAEMQPVFETWWRHLDTVGRGFLQRCVDGPIAVASLTDTQRRLAQNELVEPGLLVERDEAFGLPGTVWRDFVAEHA